MSKFKQPFRVGRHQSRAVLDAEGKEMIIFPKGSEERAKLYCELLNNEALPKLFDEWYTETARTWYTETGRTGSIFLRYDEILCFFAWVAKKNILQ